MGKRRKLQAKQPARPHSKKQAQRESGGGSIGSKPQQPPPKKSPSKPKPQQHHPEEPPTVPFDRHHRILLVGEADLSFAASIIQHHGCRNVTATVLEKNHSELVGKYPAADDNIAVVEGRSAKGRGKDGNIDDEHQEKNDGSNDGVNGGKDDKVDVQSSRQGDQYDNDSLDDSDEDVDPSLANTYHGRNRNSKVNNTLVYNIDATKLHPSLSRPPHDRILFNFPHVGGKSTDVNRQVRYNQELIVGFFRRALPALAPGGRIVVTLFEGEPYTLWNVRDLARHAGLQVDHSFRFRAAVYPGYAHARTIGIVRNRKGETGGGWKGENRPSRSYVFMRKGDERTEDVAKAKKRRRGDDDDPSDESD